MAFSVQLLSKVKATFFLPLLFCTTCALLARHRSSGSTPLFMVDSNKAEEELSEEGLSNNVSVTRFGVSVPMKRPQKDTTAPEVSASTSTSPQQDTSEATGGQKKRNIAAAVLAVTLAVGHYGWQYSHPVTGVQLLQQDTNQSPSMTVIGRNGKPTLVDVWAPWCENCRVMAPTLRAVHDEFANGDVVNFVTINGADPANRRYVQGLNVDAIPHLAMISSDGTVETALIGIVPKHVISDDLRAMLRGEESLPYTMLDTLSGRDHRVSFE